MKLKLIKNTIIKHFIDEIDEKFEEYAYMFGSKKISGQQIFFQRPKKMTILFQKISSFSSVAHKTMSVDSTKSFLADIYKKFITILLMLFTLRWN